MTKIKEIFKKKHVEKMLVNFWVGYYILLKCRV